MESNEITAFSTGDCRLIHLPHNAAQDVEVCTLGNALPFAVKRVFYIYDINTGNRHPGHAHRREQQAIVAVKGSFDVTVADGIDVATFHLDCHDKALYIPAGIWCSLSGLTADAVCLVFCSTKFDESDYIRGYQDFIALRR